MTGEEAMKLMDIAARWDMTARALTGEIPGSEPKKAAIFAGNALALAICANELCDHIANCVEVDA